MDIYKKQFIWNKGLFKPKTHHKAYKLNIKHSMNLNNYQECGMI